MHQGSDPHLDAADVGPIVLFISLTVIFFMPLEL
jgi:hypothetical protein